MDEADAVKEEWFRLLIDCVQGTKEVENTSPHFFKPGLQKKKGTLNGILKTIFEEEGNSDFNFKYVAFTVRVAEDSSC